MINTTYVRFHRLADDLKTVVTSPEAIEQIEKLEQKYGVALADLLIRLMVKEITLADLPREIAKESKLEQSKITSLLQDLQTSLLRQVMPYLSQPIVRQQPTPLPPSVPLPATSSQMRPSQPPVPRAPSRPLPPPLTTSSLVQPARPQPPQPPPTRPPAIPQPRPAPVPVQQRQPPAVLQGRSEARAAYYVDPEDEADIARHRDRLREIAGPSPTAALQPTIDTLITRAGVRVQPDQAARLSSLLLSRLRDVRATEELSTILTRPWQDGGMGMEASAAVTLASMTDDEAAKLHDARLARHLATPQTGRAQPLPPKKIPTEPPSPVPQASMSSASTQTRPVRPVIQPQRPTLTTPQAPSPTVQKPADVRPLPIQPQTVVRPVVERTVAAETNQRLIHDIKRPVRPVSPAEELASLTAVDFRQMARTFAEAAGKVLERVHLLAEESYHRRAEGIAAWRRSEIYKLYLAIGSESMATAQPIEAIIERRKGAGQPYLTIDEFAVLVDLNRQLTM